MAHVQEGPIEKLTSFLLVVGLHIVIVYFLVSGLGKTVVEVIRGPLDTKLIEEVKQEEEEEPPPPPPEFEEPPPPYVPPPDILVDVPVEPAQTTAITQVQSTIPVKKPPPPPPPPPKKVTTPPKSNPKKPITQPPYPPTSRRMGEEGSVILALYVLVDGKIGDAKVHQSSGFPRLDEAAMKEAKRRWQFIPGTEDGKPVAAWHQVKVTFKLTN